MSCFQFGAMMNKAAVDKYVPSTVEYIPGRVVTKP